MSDENFSDVFDDESFQEYLDYVRQNSRIDTLGNQNVYLSFYSGQAYTLGQGEYAFTDIKTFSGINMTEVPMGAFYEAKHLENVLVEGQNVSYLYGKIEPYAFYNCENLSNALFRYYKNIGKKAFANCFKLSDHIMNIIPDVSTIDDAAFENCYLLSGVISMASYIGDDAFYNCENLYGASPSSITFIGMRAFYNCKKLSYAYIHGYSDFYSKTIVGDYAFYNTDLRAVDDWYNIRYIGNKCFGNCINLSVAIIYNCSIIGDSIFDNCYNLSLISIPDLTYIRESAFKNLKKLSVINGDCFPLVTDIGEYAFENCELISVVFFPSCYEISSTTFKGCNNLQIISFSKLESLPDKTFGNFDPNNGYGMSLMSSIQIPICDYVGAWNFYSCNLISTIGIGTNAHSVATPQIIGSHAFGYCERLFHIGLSSNVYRIEEYAFSNCYTLDFLYGNTIQFIDSHAFEYCSALSMTQVWSQCLSVGEYAFQGCSNLSMIALNGCKSIGEHAFDGCSPSLIFVPDLSAFPKGFSENGNKFKNTTVLSINSMLKISANYFEGASYLLNISAYNASIIENNAFKNCVSLIQLDMQKISFVTTLASIDAFDGCTSLSKIVVPSSLYSAYITATNWSLLASYISGQ